MWHIVALSHLETKKDYIRTTHSKLMSSSSICVQILFLMAHYPSHNLQRPHMSNPNRFGAHCAFLSLALPYFAATGESFGLGYKTPQDFLHTSE
jgi:hypothetical protein